MNMMKLILLIALNLTACKSSHKNISNSNSDAGLALAADSNSSKSFTIINSADQTTQSYTVNKTASYALSSPFTFLTMDLIEDETKAGTYFADFTSTGLLFNISILSSPSSSCFPAGIYGNVTVANSVRLVILSTFSEKQVTALSKLQHLGDFQYCEEDRNVKITLSDADTNTFLNSYFKQRGLVLSGSLGITDGSISESLSRSSKGKGEASSSFTTSSNGKRTAGLSSEEASALEHPHGMSPTEGALIHVQNPGSESIASNLSVRQKFNVLQGRPLNERLYGNSIDRDVYEGLHLDLDQKTSWLNPFSFLNRKRLLGEGTYAQVYKVKIGSKFYAVRRETRDPEKMDPFQFMQYAAKNRMNFLVHNEFASKYPKAGFLQTHLSFYSADEFITITEFKAGGNLSSALETLPSPLRNRCVNSLRNQVQLYQSGTKIEIDEKEYKMYFFHGDIKPDNSVVNADGTVASFVDFGFSRVILQDNEGHYLQMLPVTSNSISLEPLSIYNGFGHNLVGTPHFMSPEFYFLRSQKGYHVTDKQAFIILMNADAYSENMMNFVIVRNQVPPHVDAIAKEIDAIINALKQRKEAERSVNSYDSQGNERQSEPSSLNSSESFRLTLKVWADYMKKLPMKFDEMRQMSLPGVFYNAASLEEAAVQFYK